MKHFLLSAVAGVALCLLGGLAWAGDGLGPIYTGFTQAAANALYLPLTGGTITSSGLAATNTTALAVANATAATVGVPVQVSPRLELSGAAWKSNATAASQPWKAGMTLTPVTGVAATTASLGVSFSNNGAAYASPALTLTDTGDLTIANNLNFTTNNTGLRWPLGIYGQISTVNSPIDFYPRGIGPIRIDAGGITLPAGLVVTSGYYFTATNCADSAGAAACTTAQAGSVVIDAGATSVVVSTTHVTAISQILVQEDSSLGARLGITCNITMGRTYQVTARTASTSFTITSSAAPVTNPACLSFSIVN